MNSLLEVDSYLAMVSRFGFRRTWLGQISLANEYPSLYAIASNKNDTVVDVLSTVPINLILTDYNRTKQDCLVGSN